MGKRRKPKKPYRVIRTLYRSIVMLSATIVAVHIAGVVAIRPPDMVQAVGHLGVESNELYEETDLTAEDLSPQLSKASKKERKENCFTFLLAASDDGNGNADTIMVLRYDVPKKTIGVVSIPRDTVVKTTRNMPKINAAYAKGVETLEGELARLLGIPIDFYITVDMKAFVELVDAVGGVDFDVPVEMYYHDPKQDLSIRYMPGMQHLGGQQALEVVRFRKNGDGTGYPDSDVGRTRTQQKMLGTLADKVVSWNSVTKIKKFVDIFSANVKTDLQLNELLYFASEARKLNLDTAISGGTLPGDGTKKYKGYSWCYALYQDESLAVLNQTINPYTTPLTLDDVEFVSIP